MGWTGIYNATKESIVEEITIGALKASVQGREVYTLNEVTHRGQTFRYIGVALVEKQGGVWSYKTMSEEMHPYYYRCPLSFIDLAEEMPIPEKYRGESDKWRAAVRAHHSAA